jgi:hypothetical protein
MPQEGQQARRGLDEPGQEVKPDRDEQDPEDQEMKVHPAKRQIFPQEDEQGRAGHRATPPMNVTSTGSDVLHWRTKLAAVNMSAG